MDAHRIEPQETIPASRKLGAKDAKELASKATKVMVFKGKKISDLKCSKNPDKALIEAMLGPTGNLRAPTIVFGKTVLVGFNEEEFKKALL